MTTPPSYWAKTLDNNLPGLSVRDHCVHVGCVAEALIRQGSEAIRRLLPAGSATLAALHDIGKISPGFQSKSDPWLVQNGLLDIAARECWKNAAERDHAKVTQYFLQQLMEPEGTEMWGVAAGVHHGRIFGRLVRGIPFISECQGWVQVGQSALLEELTGIFGPLPLSRPPKNLATLWCLAGLISVADWIGSNELFFPSDRGLPLDQAREAATRALDRIRWAGGQVRPGTFPELFGGYSPKPLQARLHEHASAPGLFIVEGPMGCGKTEAALWAAHRLISSGANEGIYFALPTQITSNGIHKRIAPYLQAALAGSTNLRLAHGASWLYDDQSLVLHPAASGEVEHAREGRSWFASSKHALLARFGVGTIDQALQGVVAVKHFFVRRFGLAGKVVILDEIHSYDCYTGTLITELIRELLALRCSVIILSATLTLERRRELIAASGADPSQVVSPAYPLLTVVKPGEPVVEVPVEPGTPLPIHLKAAPFSEQEILEECVTRAHAGQHVLYLRNTVVEAQAAYRALKEKSLEGRAEVGLLHGRFPFYRRQELETKWLARLGKVRCQDGMGSILIATQVVEQSVDIDLDFIVTDLAPTDMLLQRMGRLWRHHRPARLAAAHPEFWISVPSLDPAATAREAKIAFGKSGKVYAPYVLLRTARVFTGRPSLTLPDEIRSVLEETYSNPPTGTEPAAAAELRAELEKERDKDALLAASASCVLTQHSQKDVEGKLTRREGALTHDVILLRACEKGPDGLWHITGLDGTSFTASDYRWGLEAARVLHRHLVRAPRFTVPAQQCPPWLDLHVHGEARWAIVQADGACLFPTGGESMLSYSSELGLHSLQNRPALAIVRMDEDDDNREDDDHDS